MPDAPIPSPWLESWRPEIDLETQAGQLIKEVVALLPPGGRITLFGSAPLQICLEASFMSEDVDCFGAPELKRLVEDHGLGKTSRKPYAQVCDDLNFRTSPRWRDRAFTFPLEGRIVVIPHPIDILIGKLNRMEDKDLKAFQLVREKTGHPTEDDLIGELQGAVDLFRPGFDEEATGDLKINTRILWQAFFGHDIDVLGEIIRPALQRRKEGYAQDNPKTDYKADLAKPSPGSLP